MKTIHTMFGRLWRRWLAMSMLVLMTACATGPKLVSHSFNYDGFNDKWADKIDLLAYSYGDQYQKVRDKAAPGEKLGAQGIVNGAIPVGEFLFVQWRIKATGEVLEQRVELRDRLPRDMTNHELTFLMDGRQLYVYVVTPRRKKSAEESPVLKTWRSEFAQAYEIFPNLRKP
ncbi:hypothetical protein [Hydrogenophaga sp. MI9]|uniref:hypothetical protein n=1 Tax=Hydrogenophaga sp. MI9 TaxID=3453719 RepID=UPI003EED9610